LAVYEIRFLKPDGAFGAVAQLDFADDQACREHVVENWPQKPCEIWRCDERISRRTSPAFEARLRGEPVRKREPPSPDAPLVSQWSLSNMARDGAVLSAEDLVRLETAARAQFQRLRQALAPHPVWVRSENHPQAPATVDQAARFSFNPIHLPHADHQAGSFAIMVSSRERDGVDVLDDIVAVIEAAFAPGLDVVGDHGALRVVGSHRPDGARHGLFLVAPVTFDWRLTPPLRAMRDG
jgi:hypothetical protein